MDLISSISIDLVIGILKLSVVLVSRYQVGEKKYGAFLDMQMKVVVFPFRNTRYIPV